MELGELLQVGGNRCISRRGMVPRPGDSGRLASVLRPLLGCGMCRYDRQREREENEEKHTTTHRSSQVGQRTLRRVRRRTQAAPARKQGSPVPEYAGMTVDERGSDSLRMFQPVTVRGVTDVSISRGVLLACVVTERCRSQPALDQARATEAEKQTDLKPASPRLGLRFSVCRDMWRGRRPPCPHRSPR